MKFSFQKSFRNGNQFLLVFFITYIQNLKIVNQTNIIYHYDRFGHEKKQ